MKFKVFISIVLVVSLFGCASKVRKTSQLKDLPAPPFNELFISYKPTMYGAATRHNVKTAANGVGVLGGLGGLLGSLGSVTGVLLDHALAAGITSQNLPRTEKLDLYIKGNVADWDVNRAQAEYVAEKISKATSLNVRVEAVTVSASGVAVASRELTDKQALLELSATTGYGANGATDSFKPVIITEYTVRIGVPRRKVFQDKIMTVAPKDEETFMTWDGLMSEADKVPAMAGRQLNLHADKIADRLLVAWKKSMQVAQVASGAAVVE